MESNDKVSIDSPGKSVRAIEEYRALSDRQTLLLLVTGVVTCLFAWQIHWAWAVVFAVIFLYVHDVVRNGSSRYHVPLIVAALACAVVYALTPVVSCRPMTKDSAVMANLASIQADLERYAFDNDGNYPSDPGKLQDESLFSVVPMNPYSGNHMADISGIDLQAVEDLTGNFAYFPRIVRLADGTAEISGYRLLGFTKCDGNVLEVTIQGESTGRVKAIN